MTYAAYKCDLRRMQPSVWETAIIKQFSTNHHPDDLLVHWGGRTGAIKVHWVFTIRFTIEMTLGISKDTKHTLFTYINFNNYVQVVSYYFQWKDRQVKKYQMIQTNKVTHIIRQCHPVSKIKSMTKFTTNYHNYTIFYRCFVARKGCWEIPSR